VARVLLETLSQDVGPAPRREQEAFPAWRGSYWNPVPKCRTGAPPGTAGFPRVGGSYKNYLPPGVEQASCDMIRCCFNSLNRENSLD